MAAFPEQVGIHVADGGQVTVRVVLHDGLAALVGGAYTVVGHGPAVRGLFGRDDGHEDAVEFVPGLGRSFWVYMVTLLASGLSTRMVTVPAWSPEPR